jgi:hypothetical protein
MRFPWQQRSAPGKATTRSRGSMRPGPSRGRPSWFVGSPGFGVLPVERDLQIYDDMRRLFPFLDEAIVKTLRLIGGVGFKGPAALVRDMEDWARRVQVNQASRGLEVWIATHLDAMLSYGYAVGEIVPTNKRDDVFALTNLPTRTIQFRAGATPLDLELWQFGHQPAGWVQLDTAWTLLSIHRQRDDDPHGTSLFRSLPGVCQALTLLSNANQQDWERRGAPIYHGNVRFGPDFVDPDGTLSSTLVDGIATSFATAMAARKSGDLQDVFTAGEVTFEDLGPKTPPMPFPDHHRAYAEQMVAATGLPSWLLGLHWSTTERLSTVQSEMLLADINAMRREISPQLERLFERRQQLAGKRGKLSLAWQDITLADLVETQRAASWRETSQQVKVERAARMWQLGWWTQERAGKEVDPELVQVARVLEEPPAASGPPVQGLHPPQGPTS